MRDLHRGINDLKVGYKPITNIVRDDLGDLVTESYSIWLGGGTISLSWSMYMGLVTFGRYNCKQQNH
jgi:hypothetical protein